MCLLSYDLWGLWCQKSCPGYDKVITPHSVLWDAITYPCPRYLLLASKSSYMTWQRFAEFKWLFSRNDGITHLCILHVEKWCFLETIYHIKSYITACVCVCFVLMNTNLPTFFCAIVAVILSNNPNSCTLDNLLYLKQKSDSANSVRVHTINHDLVPLSSYYSCHVTTHSSRGGSLTKNIHC